MGTGHSSEHAGLQQHSLGDYYPWSVVIRKCDGRYNYTVQNLVTGDKLACQYQGLGESFAAFNKRAEKALDEFCGGMI